MNALRKSLIEGDCGCFSLVELVLVKILIVSQTTESAWAMKSFNSKLLLDTLFETILRIFLLTSTHTPCVNLNLAQVGQDFALSYLVGKGRMIGPQSPCLFCKVLRHAFLLYRCKPCGV